MLLLFGCKNKIKANQTNKMVMNVKKYVMAEVNWGVGTENEVYVLSEVSQGGVMGY